MSPFCQIWCTVCGGVLDTSGDDGNRRAYIFFDDLGSLEQINDISSTHGDFVDAGRWPEAYDSRVISQQDTEACDFLINNLFHGDTLTTTHSGFFTIK